WRAQGAAQPAAIEQIVSEDQAGRPSLQEFAGHENGARNPVGLWLLGIRKLQAPLRALAKESTKSGQIIRRGNDQDVTYAGEHQHRQGIIHHRLVVQGQELLRYGFRDWMKPRGPAAGEK